MTLIDTHTEGKWSRSIEDLSSHIRPMWRYLIPAILENGIQRFFFSLDTYYISTEIHIAIVTFSPQTSLIRDAVSYRQATVIVLYIDFNSLPWPSQSMLIILLLKRKINLLRVKVLVSSHPSMDFL
jgi:hypothetical protein